MILRARGGPKRAMAGITFIELMIVVVVLAIIAALAWPSYQEIVQRGRRSEAREALSRLASVQEQFYNNNKAYATTLADLGIDSSLTEHSYYTIGMVVDSTFTYELSATATGIQAKDTTCSVLRLTNTGAKTPTSCWER